MENVRAAVEAARMFKDNISHWQDWGKENGEPRPALFLGVTVEPVPRSLRAHLDLGDGVGLLFSKVHADSPAARSGLQDNDILLEFAGQLILSHEQFSRLLQMQKAGEAVLTKVMRRGSELELEVTLEERLRQGGRWLQMDKGAFGNLPDASAIAREVMTQLEQNLPGKVRVIVSDDREVEVDLSGLRESLSALESRLQRLDLGGENPDWAGLVDISREAANRLSLVRTDQTLMSLATEEGRVRLSHREEGRHAQVRDANGKIIFEGIIPEDFEESLDPLAARLIKALLDARQHLDKDLTGSEGLELREVDRSGDDPRQ